MSEPLVYVGMDVAKATLDLYAPLAPQAKSRQFANTTARRRALVRWLQALGSIHLVCEATGGYERAAVGAARAVGLIVSVVNARQVRDFARATGRLVKPTNSMPPCWQPTARASARHRPQRPPPLKPN
jgi:transposase